MDVGATLSHRLDDAARAVRARTSIAPKVALVLGSGLGAFADAFEAPARIAYADVPGMRPSGVEGHAGTLVLGTVEGVAAVAMQGRIHLYEGHSPGEVVFGVRLMHRLGARALIVTNAAGGIHPSLAPGDFMLIDDHLNLTGQSSLTGPNEASLGPRFVDMTEAYDGALLALAEDAATTLGLPLRRGVYAGLLGPAYETPAEVRMLRGFGASAVGMSTVLEVIAARHLGMRVLGISCITNAAAGLGSEPLDHADVERVAREARERFTALLRAIVGRMG